MRFLGYYATEMRWRPGFCPGPRLGSLQRSPDPLAGFEAATLQQVRKGGDGMEEKDGRAGIGKG